VTSKVDAVCVALTALWQELADQVVDGPQANSDASDEWLFVGADGDAPDEGAEAVAVEQELMGFAKQQMETAEVTCAVVVRDGSSNPAALRARAFEILDAASAALRADMSLSDLVMHAFVSGHTYMPVITQGGSKARVVFTVTYQAQVT
jgi:hypothetical protein